MTQIHNGYPSNHAPTYNDKAMHPLLAAINGNMGKYGYQNHMMSPIEPLEDDDTPLERGYPNSGAVSTGWGGGVPTGTGAGVGTGYSGYGYEQPTGGTGGGYGGAGGGYDYHPATPAHIPTGGSYSPYATAGSGYGAPVPPPKYHPPHPHPHPQPAYPAKGTGKTKKYSKKDSNASTMNALTLLAFFFFVNLLQTCLKDNMEAMNPTVMVLTKNVMRNRNSKLAEINSREHSTSPASAFTSGANIVVQPGSVLSAAAGAAGSSIGAAAPAGGSVTLQTSPYSDGGGGGGVGVGGGGLGAANAVNVGNNFAAGLNVISSSNNNNPHQYNNNYNNNNQAARPPEPQFSYGTQQQHGNFPNPNSQHNSNMNNNNNNAYAANPHFGQVPLSVAAPTPAIIPPQHNPRPVFHDSAFPYANQTLISPTISNLGHQYYQEHQQQHPYIPDDEPQIHRPPHKPQIVQQQPQQSYEANQYQHQHDQQYHSSHTHQHQSDHHDHYEDEHEHTSPQDHFQHHYPIEHHTQKEPHYPIGSRPLRPNDGDGVSSNPWTYRPGSSPSLNANKRGSHHSPLSSYTWSSGSLPSRVSGNNNFNDKDDDEDNEDNDRFGDTFYTRSNRRSYIDKL